ncbi:MAG: hypothetical protein ACRDK2_08805 [Solirubrobacteraceae bacterium]
MSSDAALSSDFNEDESLYGWPEKRNILIVLTKTQTLAEQAELWISSGKSLRVWLDS